MKLIITIILSLSVFSLLHAQSDLAVENHTVKIGLTHAPPLIILSDNESPQGMMVDFLKEVAIRENWEIEWNVGAWTDVYNKAKNGNLDLMTYIAYTEKREEYFNFSYESFVTGWGQVYTNDTTLYQNILDYDYKKIAIVKDDVYAIGIQEKCNQFNVNCDFIYVENYDIAFNMLKNNEVEGVVCGSTVGSTYERKFKVFRTSIMYKPTDSLFATPINQDKNILKTLDQYLSKWKNDISSPYSISKQKWMGVEHGKNIPIWLYYLFFSIVGLLIISAYFVSVLRKRIKKHIKKYMNQSNQLDQIINLVPHMIYVVNSDGEVVLLNQYASKFFGTNHLYNTTTYQLLEKVPQYQTFFENDAELLEKGDGYIFKEVSCNNYEQEQFVFNISKVLFETNDNTQSILTVGVDITEKQNYQNETQFIAEHDDLTGLPNRLLLKNTILNDFTSIKENDYQGAILFIDLDYFKNVNDSLGHLAGDELLNQVAKRIRNLIGKDDMLARIGGDEFVVYLRNQSINPLKLDEYSSSYAEKIINLMSKKFVIDDHSIFISASIGLVHFPSDATNYEQGMQRVDIAMYQAKSKGRNCYVRFKKDMENIIYRKQKIIRELHVAVENSEFFIEYQPQIDVSKDKIIGLEALLRWKNSNGDIIQPNEFISIAEESGLIISIGNWVIEEVFKQISTWLKTHQKMPFITINISVLQLYNEKFIDSLKQLTDKHNVPTHLVEFELTESVMVDQLSKTVDILNQLKKLGIRLSIDDFGTGYSSLSYLKKLPFDKLKIDYSFIKDITTNPDTKTIVKTIIGMSKDLDLDVIAEGVETLQQIDVLKKMGCNKFQGYYFDKPNSISYIKNKYFKID